MKSLLAGACLLFALNASGNILLNPGFTVGADGLDFWEGYDVPSASALDPDVFVNVLMGTASIAGYSVGETAFYQTFGVGALPTGTYSWSADVANIQDTSAFMFIKVFTGGNFGQFDGAKFQFPTLMGGTMTLTYEHDAADLVQFGFSGFSASDGFEVSNPNLVLVPEPSTLALAATALLTVLGFRRRIRA